MFETWPDWKATNDSLQSTGDEDIKGLRIKGRVDSKLGRYGFIPSRSAIMGPMLGMLGGQLMI